MTTLAYDGSTLSADGRTTAGSVITTNSTKKIRKLVRATYLNDTLRWVGFSGTCVDFDKVVNALESNTRDLSHDASGIIIGDKYNYVLEGDTTWLIRHDKTDILAAGSGKRFALAAMHLGKTSKEAVQLAIKLDCYSGGKIMTVRG